ncbi:hypothetical protein M3Y96_01226700 [Aphelenchoides besseyi]|nr:hypothetical protein M3Y96_01226700 [Aphelenchoides besseyi]
MFPSEPQMDVISRVIPTNWNNGKQDFKFPARVSLSDDFDFVIDDTRITISHKNQKFHFGHPAITQRLFTTKKRTINFTVKNCIFQRRTMHES